MLHRAGRSRCRLLHWSRRFLAPPVAVLLWVHAVTVASAETYVVQPGDTLIAIAAQTGVEVDTLVSLNAIDQPDQIQIGVELRLAPDPPERPPPPAPYTVQPGDTLLDIALERGVSVEELIELNALAAADFIVAGQVLHLPPAAPSPTASPIPLPPVTPVPIPTSAPPTSQATATTRATATPGPTSPPRPTPNLGTDPPSAGPPRAVQIALQYLGSPYAFAGVTPDGFDCSGFVYFVQKQAGRPIPRDIHGQYAAGPHPGGPLQSSDLVFFENTTEPGLSHVGIYLGSARFLHAIDEARGVGISTLTDEYWLSRWYGVTRLG